VSLFLPARMCLKFHIDRVAMCPHNFLAARKELHALLTTPHNSHFPYLNPDYRGGLCGLRLQ
jgi:hypothetical protein